MLLAGVAERDMGAASTLEVAAMTASISSRGAGWTFGATRALADVDVDPASGGGLSSNTVWWTVLAVCVAAVAVSVNGRPLPQWLPGTGITMGRDLTS
jgi:hypothetical protein